MHPSRASRPEAEPPDSSETAASALYGFGPYLLVPAQRALLRDGELVRIGSRAFDILAVLVERAGLIVGKEELLARVWPHTVVDEGGLRVHIAALRKTLGETPSGPRYISNVPTRGYCFVCPVSQGPGLPQAAPAAERPAGRQLPALMTRLVGRDETILALVRSMPTRRFVSVVGPGGMGKTTVALAVAAELEAQYADGAHFVDLSTLTEGSQVPLHVATTLGVSHGAGDAADAMQALVRWFAASSLLLVLDNCEHVVDAAADFVQQVLAHSRGCHLLATSREPLRAQSECLVPLPPLAGPPLRTRLSWSDAMRFPAFELFADRAAAASEGAVLAVDDVPQIAQICHRLDGIPLAIELVAAQIGFLGLGGLVAMLDGRLALTAMGHRTAQSRHQTLHGAIDWSFRLLSPIEQRILARLAVFRDRFTLPVAVAVTDERPAEAAHALAALVSKSLVVAEADAEGMVYRLLDTTRSYAAEKLAGLPDAHDVARRHALHCVALAQEAAIGRRGVEVEQWRERRLGQLEDVRAALTWALRERGDVVLGGQLLAHAALFFTGLRRLQEYADWLERALALLPEDDSDLQMQLSIEYGQASAALRGGATEGLKVLLHGAAVARRRQAGPWELTALRAECGARLLNGDYHGAQSAALRYGEVAEATRDARALLSSHRMSGLCLHVLGRHAPALEQVHRALHPLGVSLRQSQADLLQPGERTAALTHLARIFWVSGDAGAARMAARDALDSAQDNPISLLYTLTFGTIPVAMWSGEFDAAQRHVAQLEAVAHAHALAFWQSWPVLYRLALARCGAGEFSADAPAPPDGPLHGAQVDMLATLHPALVGPAAIERERAGRNPWCAPEILRARAEAARHAGEPEQALALARRALALATQQGARAWTLRSALTLATLEAPREASSLLRDALAALPGEADGADARAAARCLQQLAPGAAAVACH